MMTRGCIKRLEPPRDIMKDISDRIREKIDEIQGGLWNQSHDQVDGVELWEMVVSVLDIGIWTFRIYTLAIQRGAMIVIKDMIRR